jgi:hypothetical protein
MGFRSLASEQQKDIIRTMGFRSLASEQQKDIMNGLAPNFDKADSLEWENGDMVVKERLQQEWFRAHLEKGNQYYENRSLGFMAGDLTKSKMNRVLEEATRLGLLIKDPFDNGEDADDGREISTAFDTRAVVGWANRYGKRKLEIIKNQNPVQYLPSKIRFYRRMCLWMEKTVEKIREYKAAKEEAHGCGYFASGEEHFHFKDYIRDPKEYTTEAFEFHMKCLEELAETDRMCASDAEPEEECSSDSESSEDE